MKTAWHLYSGRGPTYKAILQPDRARLMRASMRDIGSRIMTGASLLDDTGEWLEADGLGGFASGTASGIRTRRYHALLLVATEPPAGRVVLVNGVEVWADTPEGSFALSSQRYVAD